MSSYKLRKVPATWEHPKDSNGNYIPLFDGSYSEYSKKFEERKEMWNKGFEKDFDIIDKKIVDKYVPKNPENTAITFEESDGEKRLPEDYRPDWPVEEQTHFQMYEDVTEGTPISPVFEQIENLAHWLANELNDYRYPYTSTRWLQILTSEHLSVDMIIEIPVQTSLD